MLTMMIAAIINPSASIEKKLNTARICVTLEALRPEASGRGSIIR
jgi:hypothetical protein